MSLTTVKSNTEAVVRLFDKDLALDTLERYRYQGQRPLDQKHVNYLVGQMTDGLFTTNTIMLADLAGERLLVNGQHTLWAISEARVQLELPVVTYFCRSEDEVALLYTTADNGKFRKPQEGFKPYGLEEKLGFTGTQLASLYAAVKIINQDFVGSKLRRGGVWMLKDSMTAWASDMQAYIDATRGSVLVHRMMRRDLVSVGLVTLTDQRPRASDFWQQVSNDNGLLNGDPRKTLHRWIIETASQGGSRVGNSGLTISLALRGVAAAWNAYFEERPLKAIRTNASPPVRLAGTRFE